MGVSWKKYMVLAGLGIRSFAHRSFAHLLISLKSNERLWAIRSGRSEEMSDVSESLISLTKNEQMSDLLKKFWLKKSKILFYYVLFKVFF